MADEHFLVAGGTRGIGLALVNELLRAGRSVSAFGRNPRPGIESSRLKQYSIDMTDGAALISALDGAVDRFGSLTCAVFMQRYRGEDMEEDLAVSLIATHQAIEHLVAARGFAPNGSIVLVTSIADRYVAPEQPPGYHVAKAGLAQLGRDYAVRLGPRGIRVNSVSPCVVAKEEAAEFYERNEWLTNRYARFIPLGRMGRPDDVVNAILFLASEKASYITGQNIVVDGGLTLRSHESLIRDFPRE